MTSRPFEYSFQIRGILHLGSSRVMERSVVYCTDDFTGYLIAQLEKMRKVIFTEGGIILLQTSDAFVFFNRCFFCQQCCIGDGLDVLTMLLPFRIPLFYFRLSSHKLPPQTCAHAFDYILVLILVNGLDEVRSKFRVCLSPVFKPFGKGHKNLNGINDVGLLVELFYYR